MALLPLLALLLLMAPSHHAVDVVFDPNTPLDWGITQSGDPDKYPADPHPSVDQLITSDPDGGINFCASFVFRSVSRGGAVVTMTEARDWSQGGAIEWSGTSPGYGSGNPPSLRDAEGKGDRTHHFTFHHSWLSSWVLPMTFPSSRSCTVFVPQSDTGTMEVTTYVGTCDEVLQDTSSARIRHRDPDFVPPEDPTQTRPSLVLHDCYFTIDTCLTVHSVRRFASCPTHGSKVRLGEDMTTYHLTTVVPFDTAAAEGLAGVTSVWGVSENQGCGSTTLSLDVFPSKAEEEGWTITDEDDHFVAKAVFSFKTGDGHLVSTTAFHLIYSTEEVYTEAFVSDAEVISGIEGTIETEVWFCAEDGCSLEDAVPAYEANYVGAQVLPSSVLEGYVLTMTSIRFEDPGVVEGPLLFSGTYLPTGIPSCHSASCTVTIHLLYSHQGGLETARRRLGEAERVPDYPVFSMTHILSGGEPLGSTPALGEEAEETHESKGFTVSTPLAVTCGTAFAAAIIVGAVVWIMKKRGSNGGEVAKKKNKEVGTKEAEQKDPTVV